MSFEIQKKIKENALEIRSYVSDLHDWEQQMELKEKIKSQVKKDQSKPIIKPQPIREKINFEPEEQIKLEKKKDLIRDVNTVGEYYKAWDKYDIDKELERLEDEETRPYRPYNPYEDSKTNLRAKPKTKISVSGRRSNVVVDPTELKDKGNLHFQSFEFERAIDCYTQSISRLDQDQNPHQNTLKSIVYSNRAMAYLKINETVKALHDCTQSLSFNDKFAKSYFRRAECYKKLARYTESLKDYKIAQVLDPSEGKSSQQIAKIEAFLAKRCKEARDALIVNFSQEMMADSKRIEIEEILEFEKAETNEKANHLEEL